MDKLKEELQRVVGGPLRDPESAQAVGYERGGVLLFGPPGTGKTFIAEATAGEFGLRWLRITAGDLLDRLVGGSEKKLREAFATAKSVPCLLFIDELDAIGAKRAEGGQTGRQLMTELLRQLDDGKDFPELVVMAATNDLAALDGAVKSRFTRQVLVDLPDLNARAGMLRAQLIKRRHTDDVDIEELAAATDGMSGRALEAIVNDAAEIAIHEGATAEETAVITQANLVQAIANKRGSDRPTLKVRGWDELILPEETLQGLQRLSRIMADPDGLRQRGIKPPLGAVLYGPPGTGKTTIAQVLASQTNASFIAAKGSDLVSKFVGDTAKLVREIFERARAAAPTIIFLDEAEAVIGQRGGNGDGASGEKNAGVAEFLAQLDGMDRKGGVFVLAATNHPDQIDTAMRSRLSQQLEIPLPTEENRRQMLALFTKGQPIDLEVDFDELAARTDGMSGRDLEALCNQAAMLSFDRDGATVGAADFETALTSSKKPEQRNDEDEMPRWLRQVTEGRA